MSGFVDVPLPGFNEFQPFPERKASTAKVRFNSSLPVNPSAIERFTSFIVKSPTCWFWTGSISSPDGYGRFTWQHCGEQRTVSAHRFALILAGIDIAENQVAEHVCNEPLCVRCDSHHVRLTTQSENISYAVALGRHRGNTAAVSGQLSRVARSRAIRDAIRHGWNDEAFIKAIHSISTDQETLF